MRFINPLPKIIQYLKEVKVEAKKISWPSRKETMKYSLIVLGISIFVAIFLWIFDILFSLVIRNLIK